MAICYADQFRSRTLEWFRSRRVKNGEDVYGNGLHDLRELV